GTGGMLSIAGEFVLRRDPAAQLQSYGQELNPESYAIAKADALLRGQEGRNIAREAELAPTGEEADNRPAGKVAAGPAFAHRQFDYMLSNPPFGVDWKK